MSPAGAGSAEVLPLAEALGSFVEGFLLLQMPENRQKSLKQLFGGVEIFILGQKKAK